MNEENSNQSVVENYWAVNSELWGQAGNTGHKGRCSDDFVYFPQLASQRGLCATEGWSPLTADASTPGAGDGAESLWCVMSPGWRQGARRDIHFIFVNSLYHFSRMHKSWILLNVKKEDLWPRSAEILWRLLCSSGKKLLLTQTQSRNISNINKNIFQPGDNLSCNNKWQVKTGNKNYNSNI